VADRSRRSTCLILNHRRTVPSMILNHRCTLPSMVLNHRRSLPSSWSALRTGLFRAASRVVQSPPGRSWFPWRLAPASVSERQLRSVSVPDRVRSPKAARHRAWHYGTNEDNVKRLRKELWHVCSASLIFPFGNSTRIYPLPNYLENGLGKPGTTIYLQFPWPVSLHDIFQLDVGKRLNLLTQ
jgi:hypothetical protein